MNDILNELKYKQASDLLRFARSKEEYNLGKEVKQLGKTKFDVELWLEEHSFHKVAIQGNFSSVWQNDDKFIVKVFKDR